MSRFTVFFHSVFLIFPPWLEVNYDYTWTKSLENVSSSKLTINKNVLRFVQHWFLFPPLVVCPLNSPMARPVVLKLEGGTRQREGEGGRERGGGRQREMSVYLLCFWVRDELNHIPRLKCIHSRVVEDLSASWWKEEDPQWWRQTTQAVCVTSNSFLRHGHSYHRIHYLSLSISLPPCVA